MYSNKIKRLLDIILSLMGIVVLSPLLVVIYIMVGIKLGYPIIFRQERPGKDEKLFYLYKFRTMTDYRDIRGELLADSERLTEFGRFLRRTSLDELPELINILRGDMSIVGPRPLLTSYLPYYSAIERKRHSVRPGLTGLAQVKGRNLLDWDERLAYDVKYVEKLSFFMDLYIIIRTVLDVVLCKGVVEDSYEIEPDLSDVRIIKEIK